jgi:4-azaleucine resistance transporter AzlC
VARHIAEEAMPAHARSLLSSSRRRLVLDAMGIALSAGAFGIVYGLTAQGVGLSFLEAMAMSVVVLAGASQFAALGLIASGTAWPAIIVLTLFLNARHLLYSAAMAPWFTGRRRLERAASAHVLTDETFAVALAHFRRLGRFDGLGYWLAAAFVCVPWIAATAIGFLGGGAIPDPNRLGLDVVFPVAMGGLAVALMSGRREVAAAAGGVLIGLGVSLLSQPAAGIVAGGLLGPLVGLALPGPTGGAPETLPQGSAPDPGMGALP